MLDDIVEGLFRLLWRLLLEVVFEILFKGPGYLIVRLYSRTEADVDGAHVFFWSVVVWVLIAGGAYYFFAGSAGEPSPRG